ANVSETLLPTLSREDIRDLFPGPEHFLRRKAIWNLFHKEQELEHFGKQYFDMQRVGQEGGCTLSKELHSRLVRNTVTNMVSIIRAVTEFMYPSRNDVQTMAKRLVEYYPMLRDNTVNCKHTWESLFKQLMKRLHNIKTPKRRQGPTPQRQRKRRCLDFECSHSDSNTSISESAGSTASTVILDRTRSSTSSLDGRNSPADKAFINSDTLRDQDRPANILQAYPCFKDVDHVMDELRRILDRSNPDFISDLKTHWESFYCKAQFYGVFKKVLRPPTTQDKVTRCIAMMKALPEMFPSPVALPKKLDHASEAMVRVLELTENPNTYLQRRPIFSPVLIICDSNCMLAIGSTPVTTFPKENIDTGVLYLLAYYYTFHLTYPKCLATLLSILQTEEDSSAGCHS
ncbi:hypothetical protein NFI96_028573, partial [Prochilodus magdalenae]